MSEGPPRRDARIASARGLLVRCDSWNEFVQHYATDISLGGLFIVTDDPPPLLSEIDVQVSLPEGHDIMLRAQVVHVIAKSETEPDKRPAGIGVQFLALDPVRKAQIHQLVEFARWEGSTGRPGATLASRMFEAAASLPPNKLMGALPPAAPERSSSVPALGGRARASSAPAKPLGSGAPTGNTTRSTAPRAGTLPPTATSTAPPADAAAGGASEVTSQAPSARTTGKPLDTDKLKMGMTHLAHRRYMQAIQVFSELTTESPQDSQPVLWRALARARLKLKDRDEAGAVENYKQVLTIDENNHEARKFVREHGQKTRLEALPFGRYFVKK